MGVVGEGGLLNTIEFNMAVQWWQHGVFCVCVCVCVCVCEAHVCRSTQHRRFDAGQFTNVGRSTNVPTQFGDRLMLWKNRSLDDDRSGGWMGWSCAVKGRARFGVGVWGGEGRGGWGGE